MHEAHAMALAHMHVCTRLTHTCIAHTHTFTGKKKSVMSTEIMVFFQTIPDKRIAFLICYVDCEQKTRWKRRQRYEVGRKCERVQRYIT